MKRQWLTMLAILMSVSALAIAATIATKTGTNFHDDFEVFYPFDVPSATVYNHGVYPQDGQFIDVPSTPQWTNDNSNGYMIFDGVGTAIRSMYTNNFLKTDDWSIIFWQYSLTVNTAVQERMYGTAQAEGAETILVQTLNSSDTMTSQIRGYTGATEAIASSVRFSNEWVQVAIVHDGTAGTYASYTNGALAQSVTDGTTGSLRFNDSQAEDIYVGALNLNDTISSPFYGYIDEFGIVARALTSTEVAWIASLGLGGGL